MLILVVGINEQDNAISRRLKNEYGCEVIHASADNGKIPTHADAIIIVVHQISHQKFREFKTIYNRMNKRVFTTRGGFSLIQGDFHKFWVENHEENKALDIKKVAKETNFRNTPVISMVPAKSQEDSYESQVEIAPKASLLVLIDTILASSLDPTLKIELLHKVRSGEVRSLEYMHHDVVSDTLILKAGNMANPKNDEFVRLSRSQAMLVALYHDTIKDFAEGK